jgi:UDPglucose 6-dehydrogenase
MVTKVRAACGGDLRDARIGVWGLTYKANTDDLRDSPAIAIVKRLLEEGAVVSGYDPGAGERAADAAPGLQVVPDPYEACDGADVLAVLTEWDTFRWLDFGRVAEAMRHASVVDTRNLLDPATMRRYGFEYRGVGR